MNTKEEAIMESIGIGDVKIRGGFWKEKRDINRNVTVPIEYDQCKKTGRIDAFKREWKEGQENKPHVFWDSDVAKWIEAGAYLLAEKPDAELEARLDEVIELYVSGQQADGYINSHYTVVEPENRWSNLRDCHELYCAGHMMEAAVAYFEATGKRTLLDAMCRFADYIDSVFGFAEGKKKGYPGHEEIELALVRLYRATGEERYLNLAKFFVDERGQQPNYFELEAVERGDANKYQYGTFEYLQAHKPVRGQKEAEGHAVRACYLYAGMADVAAETHDESLIGACRAIWKNITEKRMYVHGGIGSCNIGELFTFDYDLPNEEAYAETCAAISLAFFAHRMLEMEKDSVYADVMERALYNGIISGVSLSGDRFFYDNYLAVKPGYHQFHKRSSPRRQEWFGCACCPPNLARILASLGKYFCSVSDDEVYMHLYGDSEMSVEAGSHKIKLDVATEYPWDGKVQIKVNSDAATGFALCLRIPGWCEGAGLSVNGEAVDVSAVLQNGYARIERQWVDGDVVELDLPMPVRKIYSHPRVRHNAGRVALQRGPLVYCLEEADNGADLNEISLSAVSLFDVEKINVGALAGMCALKCSADRIDESAWDGGLYSCRAHELSKTGVTAVPYFAWGNRGPGEMIVWIRQG